MYTCVIVEIFGNASFLNLFQRLILLVTQNFGWGFFSVVSVRSQRDGMEGGGGGGGCSPFPAPSIGGQEINRYTKQKSNCPLPFHQKIDDLKKKKYWKTMIKKVSYYQMTEKKFICSKHVIVTCWIGDKDKKKNQK